LAEEIPESWRERVAAKGLAQPPLGLGADDRFELPAAQAEAVLTQTETAIRDVRDAVFPLHGLVP
jgi:hypothetical protein